MKKYISIFLFMAAAVACWAGTPKGYNNTTVSGGKGTTHIVGDVLVFESMTSSTDSFRIEGGTATLTQIKFSDGTTMETAATGSGDGVDVDDVISTTSTWTGTQTFNHTLRAYSPYFNTFMMLSPDENYVNTDSYIFQSSALTGGGLEIFKGDGTPGFYLTTAGQLGVGYAGNATGTSYTTIPATAKLAVDGNIVNLGYGVHTTSITFADNTVMTTAAIGSGEIGDDISVDTITVVNNIQLTPDENKSASVSTGGAMNITNTANAGSALTIYSDHAGSATGRVMNITADNPAFDQTVLNVVNHGTSHGVTIVQNEVDGGTNDTSAEAVDITSYNHGDTALGVESYASARGAAKITSTFVNGYSNGNASALSLFLKSTETGTAAHMIFGDTSNGFPTTGDLINIRQSGVEKFVVDADGGVECSTITVSQIVTPGTTGSITGGITEISTVTYARINTIQFNDGTVITSSSTLGGGGTGDGDFLADGTVPMTGDLDMGGQNIVSASSITATNTIYASSISATNGVYASEFYATQKTTPSKLSFWEGSGSGTNKIVLQSSATLAADLTFTLPDTLGTAGQVLAVDGAGNIYPKDDATGEAASEFMVSPSTGILAGTLANDVIASSIAVNSVHNEMITAVGADKINAGSLGASVIASSVAVNSVGITAIQATGASGYLNHDGTWSTPEAASVAANEITGGTCDTDVIVSSIGVNALSGFTGQVASNGRKLMDQYPFSVCISTPYALGTSTFSIVSVYFPCDITISTITARVVGGTNAVVTFSHRADSLSNATNGTAILSGNVTATETVWTGGTLDDATIPSGSAIAVKFVSFSGNVDRILIKGLYTKD